MRIPLPLPRTLRRAGSVVGTFALVTTALLTGPAGATAPSAAAPAKAMDSIVIGCEGTVPAVGWHHFRSAHSVAGYPGYRFGYDGNVSSDTSGVVIQLKGFENGQAVWVGIGARNGPWGGEVPWGNSLAHPEIRAQAVGTGATISWGPCQWP
ncbi:hypothetical protein [Streptomyces melanogenes]|uniref:hypothetical protein n=1 Tax=Streptomyces melanogenes TaxID=67326 RepID=UPI00167D09F6|nr:hypothetical protein [Streptomyces melanogenes]GGP77945.1 hypothetical protein GCM10010278_65380 [Streptomyces melanogenes]